MQQDLRRERFYCARGHGKMSLKTRLTLTIYYNTLDGLDLHAHFRQQRQSLQISRLADVDQLVVLRSYAFLFPTLLPAPWFPHAPAEELVVMQA